MNPKIPFKLGRRQVLLGAGGAVLAVPFLPSLLGEAQDGEPIRNFVTWRITNGHFGHQWQPADGALTGLSMVETNVREMALRDIPGTISPILDSGFDRFRDKAILFRHIDRMDQVDHQAANGLFGWSNGAMITDNHAGKPPSIDKLIAANVVDGGSIPLNLSVRWSETGGSCSFSVAPDGSLVAEPGLYPQQAYSRLFAGFTGDTTVADRRRDARRSIVDRVLPHYRSVRDNPRISATDRIAFEQHIEHMQTLSAQLSRRGAACAPPTAPDAFPFTPEAVDAAAQAQVDIAIAALRCQLVRVVNFYLDPDVLMSPALHGVEGGHHGASHDNSPGAVASILNAHRWHMRYFFDFLAKMDESPDPMTGRSMLDDSLVFLNNEIGNQNGRTDSEGDTDPNHIGLDVQTMLVGSAGGRLRTGLFLDYRTDHERSRWTRYIGTAYNRLLISCMLAMGLTPDQWEVGGAPGYGDLRGGLYDQTPPDRVVIGDLRSYLPRIAAP